MMWLNCILKRDIVLLRCTKDLTQEDKSEKRIITTELFPTEPIIKVAEKARKVVYKVVLMKATSFEKFHPTTAEPKFAWTFT